MIITLSILSGMVLVLGYRLFQLRTQVVYLDGMASTEQQRAIIATELLYQGNAKHQQLTLDETMRLIESIRKEPSEIARQALADRIIISEKTSRLGFQ